MTFRRGEGTVNVELANLQTWAEAADPTIEKHSEQLAELRDFKNNTQGKFTIIVWLVGVNIALLAVLLGVLLTWGLNHLTLRVESTTPAIVQDQPPQNTSIANSGYQPH